MRSTPIRAPGVPRAGDPAPTLVALADAATALGRAARDAGLALDDLVVLVGEIVDNPACHNGGLGQRPHADAGLLYLWRAARRTYQDAPAPRPPRI